MAAVLARPRTSAPLQIHLLHFLRFIVQVTPNVGEHQQLMSTTLQYLLSLAQSPLYKVKITTALASVTEVVQRGKIGAASIAAVRLHLDEYSALYRDLMDRIVTSTDGTWELPAAGSNPSAEVVEMNQAWQFAKNQWEFSATWDLTSN